jgi:hypothetical protein
MAGRDRSEDTVIELFRNLAIRRCSENDLSDVTWAMAQSDPSIGRALCDFFGVQCDAEEPLQIEREYPLGAGGRVDLAFTTPRRSRIEVITSKNIPRPFGNWREEAHRLPWV